MLQLATCYTLSVADLTTVYILHSVSSGPDATTVYMLHTVICGSDATTGYMLHSVSSGPDATAATCYTLLVADLMLQLLHATLCQ